MANGTDTPTTRNGKNGNGKVKFAVSGSVSIAAIAGVLAAGGQLWSKADDAVDGHRVAGHERQMISERVTAEESERKARDKELSLANAAAMELARQNVTAIAALKVVLDQQAQESARAETRWDARVSRIEVRLETLADRIPAR